MTVSNPLIRSTNTCDVILNLAAYVENEIILTAKEYILCRPEINNYCDVQQKQQEQTNSTSNIYSYAAIVTSQMKTSYIDMQLYFEPSLMLLLKYFAAKAQFIFRNETMQGGSALSSHRGGALDRANN